MALAELPSSEEKIRTNLSVGEKIHGIRQAFHLRREHLSGESNSRIWQESYTSANGMTGGVAHFGERFPRGRIKKIIQNNLHQEASDTTGFSVLFRTPEGDSLEDTDKDMIEVAKKLVQDALDQRGWTIDEVEGFDFTSSIGALGMARKIATAVGIKEERIKSGEVSVTGKYIACDGSGKALYERLADTKSHSKKVLLLSIDPVTSLMPFDEKKVDSASMQIFSNGAAVLAYQPGVDMRLLTTRNENGEEVPIGATEAIRDINGIKAIPRYYDYVKDRDGGPLHIHDDDGIIEEMTDYPYPENENGEMNPRGTLTFFVNNGAEIIAKVYKMYKEKYPDKEPDFVNSHHPSEQVLQGLKNRLSKILFGGTPAHYIPTLLDKIKWSVKEGNSSGATSLIAFNRNMSDYKPGQNGFYISFGAGGSFTVFTIEMGSSKNVTSEELQSLVA